MKNEPLTALSALLDGEEIDPATLAEALSSPGARELLRDFALLRAEVRGDESAPGPEAYRRMNLDYGSEPRLSWWRRAVPVPAPLLATAAALLVSLSVWVGIEKHRAPAFEVPPVPDQVLRFEPGVDWHEEAAVRERP